MSKNQNKKAFISVVIPAAGHGSRMKASVNKQYLSLRGKAILSYTLDAFEKSPIIDEIILVINPKELKTCQNEVLEPGQYKKVRIADGGASRQESVFSGLKAVSEKCDYVLIHDGARPMITEDMIVQCVNETVEYKATVVGVPAKNTIKVITDDGLVDHTPNRDTLYEIQTPQSFDYDLIIKAHEKALESGFIGSDDASLVEMIGEPVKIILGNYNNLKITTPEDLVIAESILSF